jgi:hypothetical protein
MKIHRILAILVVIGLLFVLAMEPGLVPWTAYSQDQQGPESETALEGEVSIEEIVTAAFTYQGVLSEDGAPVTGTRDLSFRLFSDETCTTSVSGIIQKLDVQVTDGLFSVDLAFTQDYFNGQGLWLSIQVGSTVVGCQQITTVPYALGLRPGATIEGTVDEMLVIDNTNTGGGDWDSLIVRNDSGSGEAVEVAAVNNGVASFASQGHGVWGQTNSQESAGVLARGYYQGADLLLGGNNSTATGDDGRIHSDPQYPSSDIIVISNDAVSIYLDQDDGGEDADFYVYDKDGTLLFDVDESGDVDYSGALLGAFPRPAFDSGWQSVGPGAQVNLSHGLGGDVDDYVVDLTCQSSADGVNAWGVGGDWNWEEFYGAYWFDLTNSSISVKRMSDDDGCPNVRIRVWVYK